MCSHCYHLLYGLVETHQLRECPLRKNLYCARCAVYGHQPGKCPKQAFRVPFTPEGIQAALKAHGAVDQGKVKNIQMLRDIANTMNPPRKLVFYSP